MKKLTILVAAVLLFTANHSFAQTESYDLSDYKLPFLKRQALETQYNLSGSNKYYRTPVSPYPYREVNENGYNLNLSSRYTSFLNTISQQKTKLAEVGLTGSYSNEKRDKKILNEYNSIQPTLFFRTENRHYNENLAFFEHDFILNYSGGFSRYLNDGNESNFQRNTLGAVLPLKVGYGRIEFVHDARQAIYIFDELAKVGRLNGTKSKADITAFAEKISELRNERFFDSRLKKIYEIEAIDSFLRQNNHVNACDARYFSTLNDYWDFGTPVLRSAGTRISAIVAPGYLINNVISEQHSTKTKMLEKTFFVNTGLEIVHEKPINLSWQNSMSISGFYSFVKGKSEETSFEDTKLEIPNIQVEFSHKLGYYPNTRTYFDLYYSIRYCQVFEKTDIENNIVGAEGKGAEVRSGLNFYYYISPKVRLSLNSSLSYFWQKSDDQLPINFIRYSAGSIPVNGENILDNNSIFREKDFYSTFNIGLSYSIF